VPQDQKDEYQQQQQQQQQQALFHVLFVDEIVAMWRRESMIGMAKSTNTTCQDDSSS
jgi:hypothetical protein